VLLFALGVTEPKSYPSSCHAPPFGEPLNLFRPQPEYARDSIELHARGSVTAIDVRTFTAARADIGINCAIDIIANLGGLRAFQMQATSEVCRLMAPGLRDVQPKPEWYGFDRITSCTIWVTRDTRTSELRHASMRVVASGGGDGGVVKSPNRQYVVLLTRYAGSREWTVTHYNVGVPE
jgi:hypothetical protein